MPQRTTTTAPQMQTQAKLNHSLKRSTKRKLFVLAVLGPAFVWFMIFMILPIINVIVYSFTNAHMAYSSFKFVGLDQYVKMFTKDPIFFIALKNTIVAAVIIVPITVVLSVLLAAGLNAMTGKMREFFTFVYFLPSVVSVVAISLVWRWLYHQNFGLFNAIIKFFGGTALPFLTSSELALPSLCVIQIWCIFGYYAVVLLAAIRNIDRSLFEAAGIDGANAFQQFFRITLPLLRNNILFVCIMSTTTAFMFFMPVKILTNGTPGTSTQVLLLHIMNRGITNSDVGYASAMSMVLMMIILFFSLIQFVLTKERKPRPSYMRPELRARMKKEAKK